MTDEFVEEMQKARQVYGERFSFDLAAIGRDLREQERKSGRTILHLEKKGTDAPLSDEPEPETLPGLTSVGSRES